MTIRRLTIIRSAAPAPSASMTITARNFCDRPLTADTTATDFAYTRRIEQFYNPQIVSGSGDEELANIYYMEPDQVNIYVNTPSAYWGIWTILSLQRLGIALLV